VWYNHPMRVSRAPDGRAAQPPPASRRRAKLHARITPILLVLLLAPGVALADRTDPCGGTGGGPIAGTLSVRVVREGTCEPVPVAFVMVGPRAGSPFAGNYGFADAGGAIAFTDPALLGPVDVTAGADGCRYLTLVGVDANDLVLSLRPIAAPAPLYRVGDYVSGIDVDNGFMHSGDGYVDMAFVLPTMRMSDLMSFDMAGLMGPPETIYILGQPFDIPSNVFLPQQWETFVEIIKDHYYLYLAPGGYTLGALSGRVSVNDLLSAGDITEILSSIAWREIDVRDVTVTGDTNDADLTVDPDLVNTVTMNLANVPAGSTTFCLSVGDLDNMAGLGRMAPLGIRSFACAGGGGPCGGTVALSTTAATGEFAGMGYLAAAMVQLTDTDDGLVILDRAPHPQTYTTTMSSFFNQLDLGYGAGEFVWNDATNPATGSPPVRLQMARIGSAETSDIYWELMVPAGRLDFSLPLLPPVAPPGPPPGTVCLWNQAAIGLGYALPSFDYDAFAFSDVYAHMSHLAVDALAIDLAYDPQGVPETGAGAIAGVTPNPFRGSTRIRLDLPRRASVDLAIYGVDGRRVATLLRGALDGGAHEVPWLGRDARGRAVPSGVYWARLTLDGERRTRMVVLQK
jgi:hypothetical protein